MRILAINTSSDALNVERFTDMIRTWAIAQGGINVDKDHLKGELFGLREYMGRWQGMKLVRRNSGLTLDKLLIRAIEDGFLFEDATLDDLLDALRYDPGSPEQAEDSMYERLDKILEQDGDYLMSLCR